MVRCIPHYCLGPRPTSLVPRPEEKSSRLKAYQLCVSQKYNQNNEGNFFHYCTTVFTMYPLLILVSSPSSPVSKGRGGGGTGGELAPSLLTAPRRRLLLIVAGDVEINPGPRYGE